MMSMELPNFASGILLINDQAYCANSLQRIGRQRSICIVTASSPLCKQFTNWKKTAYYKAYDLQLVIVFDCSCSTLLVSNILKR